MNLVKRGDTVRGVAEFISAIISFDSYHAFSIHSWKRTAKYNRIVGGKELSGHRVWLSIDGIYDEPLGQEEIEKLERVSKGLGLLWILYVDKKSFHVEPANYP